MPIESTAQRLLPHLRRVALGPDAVLVGDGQLLGTFVSGRDEAAFAALVRRHGPMVLGVCRRVIGDPHLAEDAFQATFLVLARRAAAVRPRHHVGPWLHGVAYRTALKARGSVLRRNAKEKQVDAMPHPPVSPDQAWMDLQPVIDAELARLPDKYRVPVVLCDLNGRPQRDVARELKVPPATLANRLTAARRLLAKRLAQRGVTLSGGAIAAALGWHAATAAVPPALVHGTVKAACAAAAGNASGLPVPVVELSEGVMRMFVLSKLRAVAAGVATGLVLLAGLGVLAGSSLRANPDERPAKAPDAPGKANPKAGPKAPESDDAVYLRRTSLDLRGFLPTLIEMRYFLTDTDAKKRGKVFNWMLAEHGAQKATAQCQSCHTAPFALDLRRADWHQHLFLGTKLRNYQAHDDADAHARIIESYFNAASQRVADESVEVQRAKSAVDAAQQQVRLRQFELHIAANKVDPKSGKSKVEEVARATLELQQVEQQLRAAEAILAATQEKWKHFGRKKAPEGSTDSETSAQQYERLIRDYWSTLELKVEISDQEFFRRLSLDVRGFPPTKVEENYFQADKGPKKRERLMQLLFTEVQSKSGHGKLIQDLLSDPEVQKRWTAIWNERLRVEQKAVAERERLANWVRGSGDRLDRLLAELLNGKRTDEAIVDALCLATMGRFATDTERKLITDGLKDQADRRAAWAAVLRALASTQEAKAHADGLSKRGAK
jgi:RNA polymerase sigma factor (sigma-70 family)